MPIELGTIVLDPSPFGANFPPLPNSLSYFLGPTVRPVEPGPVGSPTILVLWKLVPPVLFVPTGLNEDTLLGPDA